MRRRQGWWPKIAGVPLLATIWCDNRQAHVVSYLSVKYVLVFSGLNYSLLKRLVMTKEINHIIIRLDFTSSHTTGRM